MLTISANLCDQESERMLPTFEAAPPAKSPVPVVKAKATSLMSSIMISKSMKTTEYLHWGTFIVTLMSSFTFLQGHW